ncbi:MAG: hypothetical protein K0Q66_1227 [Chitinophagaceae bacterium]|jgi:hypothetical protein|nr:hypothetical protein [Chitinophagaceae bacterium]
MSRFPVTGMAAIAIQYIVAFAISLSTGSSPNGPGVASDNPATPIDSSGEVYITDSFSDEGTTESETINAPLNASKQFYALVDGQVYLLGTTKSRYAGVAMAKFPSIRAAVNCGKKLRSLQDTKDNRERQQLTSKWESQFRPAVFQDESDQAVIIDAMRAGTIDDGKERGCFVKIFERTTHFEISMEPGFYVSNDNNSMDFRFPCGPGGEISLVDKAGDVIIGTLHMHSHDKGLSGSDEREITEPSDMANVKYTEIPWVAAGPNRIHAGYVGQYNSVLTEEVKGFNIVYYIFQKVIKNL